MHYALWLREGGRCLFERQLEAAVLLMSVSLYVNLSSRLGLITYLTLIVSTQHQAHMFHTMSGACYVQIL